MFNNRIQKRYDSFASLSHVLSYLIKGAGIRSSSSCCLLYGGAGNRNEKVEYAVLLSDCSGNTDSTWQCFLSGQSNFTKKIVTFLKRKPIMFCGTKCELLYILAFYINTLLLICSSNSWRQSLERSRRRSRPLKWQNNGTQFTFNNSQSMICNKNVQVTATVSLFQAFVQGAAGRMASKR